MRFVPDPPAVPEPHRASGEVLPRYEDIGQRGLLTMQGIPHAIGAVFWRHALQSGARGASLAREGIVPILTRLATEGGAGPVAVVHPMRGDASYRLARVEDAAGEIDKLLLEVWVDLWAPAARQYGPPPDNAGEMIHAGRVFAEHVFTRLFAEPGQRKVTRFDGGDMPVVPETTRLWSPPHELLELPPGAEPLDELAAAPEPFALGVDHTDWNSHVNSLVYPALFRDAALQRLAALGQSTDVAARYQETAFRKPCFAGQLVRVVTRPFEQGGQPGVVGFVVLDEEWRRAPPSGRSKLRAHCYGRVLFE